MTRLEVDEGSTWCRRGAAALELGVGLGVELGPGDKKGVDLMDHKQPLKVQIPTVQ